MNTINKEFINLAAINVVAFFSQNAELVKELPIKMRWALKKNLSEFETTVKNFEDFRQELITELQEKYFDDKHSEEAMIAKLDENGVPVMDAEGNTVEEPGRKVKEKYMAKYNEAVDEINNKINELLAEKNEYKITTVNIDKYVESLPDDAAVSFELLEMLSFMDEGDE